MKHHGHKKVTDDEGSSIWRAINIGTSHSECDECIKTSKGGHSYCVTDNWDFDQVMGGR